MLKKDGQLAVVS